MRRMREYFDLGPTDVLSYRIDSEQFSEAGCTVVATHGSELAKIYEKLLKADDGRLIKATVVADEDQSMAVGVKRGWYVARFVSQAEASRIKNAWSML